MNLPSRGLSKTTMSRSSVKVSKFGLLTYLLIVTLSVSSKCVAYRLLGLPTIFDDRKTVHNETLAVGYHLQLTDLGTCTPFGGT